MYNTEKYIGVCLASLGIQTFQDFEVIVVDDCSTDNSREIVARLAPRFGGRIKLFRMDKNSGGAGIPSNIGIKNSRGKYIFVMDNDDLIDRRILETFYNFAEEFNADFVYLERGYTFSGAEGKLLPDNEDLTPIGWAGNGPFVNKPTLEIKDDVAERIDVLLNDRIGWGVWQKFFRRDLVVENQMVFPNLKSSQDILFTLQLLFYSKRFLRLPHPFYIYRQNNANSICKTKRNDKDYLTFWTMIDVDGVLFLNDFFSKQKFFQEKPHYKTLLIQFWNDIHFRFISRIFNKLPYYEVHKIFQGMLNEKFGELGDFMASTFYSASLYHYRHSTIEHQIKELEERLNAQIKNS